jgi:hypothetical protein
LRTKASIEEQAIKALLKRKREYERYFDSLRKKNEKMDSPAQNAYTTIIKTLVELSRKKAEEAKSSGETERTLEEVLRDEYGIE